MIGKWCLVLCNRFNLIFIEAFISWNMIKLTIKGPYKSQIITDSQNIYLRT